MPPETIGDGEKFLTILGGATATRLSFPKPVLVLFVPVCEEEIKPLTLLCGPAVVAVTVTTTVHDDGPATNVPPLNVIVLPPAVPDTVPPHCGEEGTLANTMPAGSVSVNARPVSVLL